MFSRDKRSVKVVWNSGKAITDESRVSNVQFVCRWPFAVPPITVTLPTSRGHANYTDMSVILRQSMTMQQSPRWLQWDAPHLLPKLFLPLQRFPPPFNTPIPRPIPLTTPNGIQIQSAVLPQYTLRTDIHTNRQMG